VLDVVKVQYDSVFLLSEEEFEDAFGPLLPNPKNLFNILKNKDSKVDIYEAFSCFYIYCRGKYDLKIYGLFKLFDFDDSEDIDLAELSLTFQSVIKGISKLLGAPYPVEDQIMALSKKAMKLIDFDKSNSIDFMEFSNWLKNDEEIQDFLIKYTGFQPLEHAITKYEVFCKQIMDCYKEAQKACEEQQMETKVPKELLKAVILEKGTVEEKEVSLILDLLVEFRETDAISLTDFENSAKALASFLSVDLDHSKSLDTSELKALLWLCNGEEPNDTRVQYELSLMDANQDGYIDLLEWVKYLTMPKVKDTPF